MLITESQIESVELDIERIKLRSIEYKGPKNATLLSKKKLINITYFLAEYQLSQQGDNLTIDYWVSTSVGAMYLNQWFRAQLKKGC